MEQLTIILRLLGDLSMWDYIVYFIFIALGVTASIRLQAEKRDRLSCATPYHFDFKFFIFDNLPRAIGSIIVAFLILRFWSDYTSTPITELQATLIGLCYDLIKELFIELKDKYRTKIRTFFNEN